MILAASNIGWAPEDRIEAYRAMVDAGLTGLEIAPGMFFPDSADPFRPDAAEARRAVDEIAQAGLRLVSMQALLFGVEGATLFGDADGRARFTAGMVRAIDLAGRLGIPNLVFGSPGQRRIPDGTAPERARAEAVEVFRALGDRAVAAGTVIAMEPNPVVYGTNFLTTLAEARDFVIETAHPGIRLILDLGTMAINGQGDQTAVLVPGLLPVLNHVHVSEPQLAPAPADPDRLAPVLAALAAAGYSRAVSIEMKRPESGMAGLVRSLGLLRAAMAAEAME